MVPLFVRHLHTFGNVKSPNIFCKLSTDFESVDCFLNSGMKRMTSIKLIIEPTAERRAAVCSPNIAVTCPPGIIKLELAISRPGWNII